MKRIASLAVLVLALLAAPCHAALTVQFTVSTLYITGDTATESIVLTTYLDSGTRYFVVSWNDGTSHEWDSQDYNVTCADVSWINVDLYTGGDDSLDISVVNSTTFPNCTYTSVDAGYNVDSDNIFYAGHVDGTWYLGAGDDQFYGVSGNDIVYGGDGADTIRGFAGDDELYGDGGADYLYGGDGSDELDPGAGDDYVDTGYDDGVTDYVYGVSGNGADEVYLTYDPNPPVDDYLDGYDGSDTIYWW